MLLQSLLLHTCTPTPYTCSSTHPSTHPIRRPYTAPLTPPHWPFLVFWEGNVLPILSSSVLHISILPPPQFYFLCSSPVRVSFPKCCEFSALSHFVVPSTLLVNCWSTGITNVLACTDGSFCNKETHADGWDCCGVGLRALCPADHYACNSAATNTVDFTCQDYTPHCSNHNGLKVCPGEFSHFKLHICLLSVCYY